MQGNEQIAQVTVELNAFTDRIQEEYDLPLQVIIGIIEVQKAILMEELLGLSYEVEDDDDTSPQPLA
jgi:hypothetical protein